MADGSFLFRYRILFIRHKIEIESAQSFMITKRIDNIFSIVITPFLLIILYHKKEERSIDKSLKI